MKIGKLAIKRCARRWLVGLAVLALWTPARFASAQVATNANSVPQAATNGVVPVPVEPGLGISGTQLAKVLAICQTTLAHDLKLDKEECDAVGFPTQNGEGPMCRQLGCSDTKNILHGFVVLPDGKGYILEKNDPNDPLMFWVTKEFVLIKAYTNDKDPRLKREIAFWAAFADEGYERYKQK